MFAQRPEAVKGPRPDAQGASGRLSVSTKSWHPGREKPLH
jgi:hypothetical protein